MGVRQCRGVTAVERGDTAIVPHPRRDWTFSQRTKTARLLVVWLAPPLNAFSAAYYLPGTPIENNEQQSSRGKEVRHLLYSATRHIRLSVASGASCHATTPPRKVSKDKKFMKIPYRRLLRVRRSAPWFLKGCRNRPTGESRGLKNHQKSSKIKGKSLKIIEK